MSVLVSQGAVEIDGVAINMATAYSVNLNRDGGARLRVEFLIGEVPGAADYVLGSEYQPSLVKVRSGGKRYMLTDISLVAEGHEASAGGGKATRCWHEYAALSWRRI